MRIHFLSLFSQPWFLFHHCGHLLLDGESSRLLPLKQPVQRDERGALAVSLTCPVTRPARPHSTPAQKKPSHNKRGKRTASDVVTEFKPVLSEASQDDHIGR